jgi:hypothetical protein
MIDETWFPFDGDYEKDMQDIKLHDGRVIFKCWPNAGRFVCCCNNSQPDVPVEDVAFVRPTIKEWG